MTMFQRVRLKLTALTVTIFVCLYTVSSVAVYGIVRHVVLQGIDARLEPLGRFIAAHAMDQGAVLNRLPTPPIRGASGIYVFLHTPAANLTNAPSDIAPLLQQWAQDSGNRSWRAVRRLPAGNPYRVLYIPAPGPAQGEPGGTPAPGVWVLLATDFDREQRVLDGLAHVLWVVGGCGCVVATVGGFYLAERALRPIRKAWQQQLEFVANASHELRTPLAVIQTNLGVVLEHPEQTVLSNLEWINNAHSEARRLAKLVADLLTLARTDSEQMPVARDRVELTELLQHVAELFEGIAQTRQLELRTQIEGGLAVTGDRDRLHQLMVILLDNACKFTPAGGRVELRAVAKRTGVLVEVADTGVGISEADLPRVFDRFYRADKARVRDESSGAGLGLSIARWIVEAHHGRIWITSRLGEGTTVHVQLPPAPMVSPR